jgi:hypothetical protein
VSHPQLSDLAAIKQIRLWKFLTVFAFLGWLFTLATLLYIWYQPQLKIKNNLLSKSFPQTEKKLKQQLRFLQQSCQKEDMQAIKDNLIQWGKLQWPSQTIQHLYDITLHSSNKQLNTIIKQLDFILYAPVESELQPQNWQAQKLWQSVKQYPSSKKNETQESKIALPEINPKIT